MDIFGLRLKELRREENLSQMKLAQYLDVRNTTISSWELGISEPDQKTLIKLALFFKVSIDYLLGLED